VYKRPSIAASPAQAEEFTTFLSRVDAAQLELQNGRPAAFKALWSQADEVTLSGGFGGTIERAGPRSAAASTGLAHGSRMGQIASTSDSTREYRVTMIFRREAGEWRIVHRQADSQLTRQ